MLVELINLEDENIAKPDYEQIAINQVKSAAHDLAKNFSVSLAMVLEHLEENLHNVFGWDWSDIEELEIKAFQEA